MEQRLPLTIATTRIESRHYRHVDGDVGLPFSSEYELRWPILAYGMTIKTGTRFIPAAPMWRDTFIVGDLIWHSAADRERVGGPMAWIDILLFWRTIRREPRMLAYLPFFLAIYPIRAGVRYRWRPITGVALTMVMWAVPTITWSLL